MLEMLRQRCRALVGEAQRPILVGRKVGQFKLADIVGSQSAACDIRPLPRSWVKPSRTIAAHQLRSTDAAFRATLLKIGEERLLILGTRRVRPSLIAFQNLSLV